jgi:membrane protein DedA with SNARE-associated domain
MAFFENFLQNLSGPQVQWFYLILFASCLAENLFPPYPGDTVILLAGYLAGSGHIFVSGGLVCSVAGSLSGALILFALGSSRGRALFRRGRFRFLSPERLDQVEAWFTRHGKKVILASRFLPGVRSLVAVTAGIGRVQAGLFALFSLISILIWNGLLLFLGLQLGQNWAAVVRWFRIYTWVVVIILLLAGTVWYLKTFGPLQRRGKSEGYEDHHHHIHGNDDDRDDPHKEGRW